MEDWYNDSLPRYPRVLIQRERGDPTYPSHAGENLVRIRVHGRRVGNEELEAPRVTVHRYSHDRHGAGPRQPTITVGHVKSGTGTAVPIQVKRMATSPVTNIASAQRQQRFGEREPLRAVPLTSFHCDVNANPVSINRLHTNPADIDRPFTTSSTRLGGQLPFPQSLLHSADSSFQSFEKEFDRFTSEYTNLAKKRYSRSDSGRTERSEIKTFLRGAARASSPNLFTSSYTQSINRGRPTVVISPTSTSTPTIPVASPTKQDFTGHQSTTQDERQLPSVAKAKWILDRVLRDLDGLKGRRNSTVTEAKDAIQQISERLSKVQPSGDDNDSGYSGSGDTTRDGFTWSTVEIKEKIRKYNENHHENKFTEMCDRAETFQGNIQICMCLEHPVNMLLSTRPASVFQSLNKKRDDEERITASATIPDNTITKLRITSMDTADVVVQQLLNKFNIIESPKSYGLYEQTLDKDKEVKLRKTACSEKPLLSFLRWKTMELQEQRRFLLKETYNAEIMWESFSTPELTNFLLMLDMECQAQEELVRDKYTSCRRIMELRMRELKPSRSDGRGSNS